VWAEYHRDQLLDAWEHADTPTHEEKMAVYTRAMDLRENPRCAFTWAVGAYVGFGEGRYADVPGTTVGIYYIVYDELHAISYAMFETL
jgi:hypothetical protein